MFCGKCGSEVTETSAFCGNCGAKIEKIVEPPRMGLRKSNFVGGNASASNKINSDDSFQKASQTPQEPEVRVAEPMQTPQEPEVRVAEPMQTPQEPEVRVAEPMQTPQEPEVRVAEPMQAPQEPEVRVAEPMQAPQEPEVRVAEPMQTPQETEVRVAEPVQIPQEPEVRVAEPVILAERTQQYEQPQSQMAPREEMAFEKEPKPDVGKSKKADKKLRENPQIKKGHKVAMTIVSVIICIMVFATTTLLMLAVALRMWLSPDNIGNIVQDIDETAIAETLLENVEGFDELSAQEQEYQVKQLKTVIEKTSVKELVEELVNNCTGYVLQGEVPEEITADTIIKYIRRDAGEIEEIYGYELTESEFLDIEEYINENIEVFDPISNDVADNTAVNLLKVLCSKAFIVIFAVLDLLLLLWLFFARKWSLSSFGWFAVPLLLSSVLFVAALFFSSGLLPDSAITDFVEPVLANIRTKALIQGGIGIGVSVLLIMISILSSKLRKRQFKDA